MGNRTIIQATVAAQPNDVDVKLPLWAAKLALRLAGLGKGTATTIFLVRDADAVRVSIDSVNLDEVIRID